MVAVARLGRERECRKDIRSHGFRCWHPIERATVVKRGRKSHVDRLLLGPYLFVHVVPDLGEDDGLNGGPPWEIIPSLKHCEGVLMRTSAAGTEPAIATDEEVQRFRDLEDGDGFIRDTLAKQHFSRGDAVRVIMGAFTGFKATFISSKVREDQHHDTAEIEYFGRKTRIQLPPGALEAA